jgi:tetratricopeptide (TPR) repeat protein
VSWRLPGARIFMDMRMPEPFSTREVWLYKSIGDGVDLETIRRRYGLDAVVVRAGSPLARRTLAGGEKGFAPAYVDHAWALFLPESVLAARPDLRVRFLAEMERIADGGAPAVPREDLAREADRLVEIWPGNHVAQRTRLWLRTTGGRPREAAADARALGVRHPRIPAYPFCEGVAWSVAGDREAAAAAFRRAIDVDEDFDPAYPALARTLAALGRTGPALAVIEDYHVRRRYRLGASDTVLLAALRADEGRLAEAAEAYERALWITPETDASRAVVELGLASVSLRMGRADRALELADAALARQPGLARAVEIRDAARRARGAP